MFKKPLFWIGFGLLSFIFAFTTAKLFRTAIPQVSVEITMDREAALEQAIALADSFSWGPENYRIAVSYRQDDRVKNFVELEAGGIEGFQTFLEEGNYHPYYWRVRLFQEQDANETNIRFTPDGTPYGFTRKLPENEPGAIIESDSARAFAEDMAITYWHIDFSDYELAETSETLQQGGRLDHSFVYERSDISIADAPFRLTLDVSGDQFTGLMHQVRVPESFERRYEEMRSANETMANVATIISFLLLVLFGCGYGLYYLIKNRYLIWKTPVFWGVTAAFLLMLTHFNSWALLWMDYDTALSLQGHIIEQITVGIIEFIGFSIFFSLVFMVAESLSRKAFPHHIQFWKLWSPGVANTRQVLGITAAAFLLVSYELFYVTGVYYVGSTYLGWWYPSSELFHPDIVAVYFPWLDALSISLQAAFWEESLFRAIPIAGAVLLGKRYGNTVWWVVAAFVLQAFLFGAGHANYPQQPFYARTLELIFPSLIFGLLYYFLGLYSAILLHFWYNFTLFSIPVFSSSIPGMLPDKVILILIGLFPFWIILFQYFRSRNLKDCEEKVRNKAWIPQNIPKEQEAKTPVTREQWTLSARFMYALVCLGIVGFAIWIYATDFRKDVTPIEVSRSEAQAIASNHLNDSGQELPDTWKQFLTLSERPSLQHLYVMETGGEDIYKKQLENYLFPASWYARHITFDGDINERAREYRIFIRADDGTTSFMNILPENQPGANLEEYEARAIADMHIMGSFRINPENLSFISAVSNQRPERTDWTIIYADPEYSFLGQEEARIRVNIAGEDVIGSIPYIHVSEEWSRAWRDQQTIPNTIRLFSIIIMVLLLIAGVVTAIIFWTKGAFKLSWMLVFFTAILIILGLRAVLTWPDSLASFSTAQPFITQLLSYVALSALSCLVVALIFGLISGFIHRWTLPVSKNVSQHTGWALALGIFPVLAFSGIYALIFMLEPVTLNWGLISEANSVSPVLSGMTQPFMGFIIHATLLILVVGAIHLLSSGWRRRRVLCVLLFILSGLFLAGIILDNTTSWLYTGLANGLFLMILYIGILRYHIPIIVLMAGTWSILNFSMRMLEPLYPGALPAFILGSLIIAICSWMWYRSWVVALEEMQKPRA